MAAPPKIWSDFPPFFTLQPNDAIRATQLEEWGKLLLADCKARGLSILSPYREWSLWENPALRRALPEDGRRLVLEALVAQGRAMWADDARVGARVLWLRVDEWAAKLYAFLDSQGKLNQVLTFEELSNSSRHDYVALAAPEELVGLEKGILREALLLLEKQGLVDHYPDTDGTGNDGYMFK